MPISINTLNAITDKFFTSKQLADLVFHATPTLRMLEQRKNIGSGVQLTFPVMHDRLAASWRSPGEPMTFTQKEIATLGILDWRYLSVGVQLYQEYVDQNRNNPRAIANYLQTYVQNATESIRAALSEAIWTPYTTKNLDSIADAVSDKETYAGLSTADIPKWKSIIAEATYGSPSVPVSPSLDNFRKMIMIIQTVTAQKPDLIVTSMDVWERLAEQVSANDVVAAIRSGEDVVRWGFSTIYINGVPCVADVDMQMALCTPFNPTGSDRATCGGHQAFFLNFNHLELWMLEGWDIRWRPQGWFYVADNTTVTNTIMFAGNIVCTNRRTQGRIYGIDPTQDQADFTHMHVDLTDFV